MDLILVHILFPLVMSLAMHDATFIHNFSRFPICLVFLKETQDVGWSSNLNLASSKLGVTRDWSHTTTDPSVLSVRRWGV